MPQVRDGAVAAYRAIALVLLLVAASACTTRGVYEGLRARAKLDCQSVPAPEYEQCLRQAGEGYDSYSEQRGAVVGEP